MTAHSTAFDRISMGAFLLYVLSVGVVWTGSDAGEVRAQDAIQEPIPVEQPEPPKRLTGPVKIDFDLKKLHKETSNVFSVCEIPAPSDGAAAPWKDWIAFEGKRLKSTCTQPNAPVYAVKTPEGVALCVTNPTEDSADVRVNATLPRGVYTIERALFDLVDSEESGSPREVERLSGGILGETGILKKSSSVPAESISAYRWVNRTQQAFSAFRGAKQLIKSFKGASGAEYRWLMVPFRECESNMAVLDRGIDSHNRYKVLKHVHRAILTAAHTEALSRNFTGQGRISKKAGDALTAKLNALDEALSELSLACLGLTPDTLVETGAESGAQKVTVSVTNRGSRTINFVKVGAMGAAGVQVSPEELATFGSLRPGETARSVHVVRCKKAESLSGISAHIGYLAGKSPVRLRIRPVI